MTTVQTNTTNTTEDMVLLPSTSRICGASIIIVSILGLIPYTIFIWLVFTKKKLNKSFFKLAGSLGIADCICLILMIGYAGPCTILQRSLSDSKVLGFFLGLGWFSGLPLIIFLSLDRYLCICNNQQYNIVYTPAKTNIYCIACWVFGGVYSFSTLFDCCVLYFDHILMTWGWDISGSGAVILSYGELGLVIVTITATYTLNGFVIRKVHQMQKSIGTLGAAHDLQKSMREKKIFFQFLITTIWLIIVDVPFIAIGYVKDPSFWFGYFVTMAYIINCSINGWVYVVMNTVIKREVKSMFKVSRRIVDATIYPESSNQQTTN